MRNPNAASPRTGLRAQTRALRSLIPNTTLEERSVLTIRNKSSALNRGSRGVLCVERNAEITCILSAQSYKLLYNLFRDKQGGFPSK